MEKLRTKQQTLSGDSSSVAEGDVLDISGIGGDIMGVFIKPSSGTAQIQGRSGDDWVEVPSGGLTLTIDFDQAVSNHLPKVRNTGGASATLDLYFYVKVRGV